jgi:sugar lactone lactonase YvrE
MASTYSSNLKIELMATGENSNTWGTVTNTNLGTALEQAIVGYGNPDYASDANLTISITNTNAAQAARALVLNVTSAFGSLTATRELIVPTSQKQYIVQNNTTGGQSITVKTSAGTGITVPNGRKAHLYVDGTNVIQMFDFVDINGGAIDGTTIGAASASTGAFTSLAASGTTTFSGLTASTALALDASKNAVSVTNTGTGNNVLATSPTLVTPALGTPSSATLTNATGLPVSTGISGLGAGVATFLATPSSANLRTAVTDETGTGALVFATSPTLVTPALGTPSALVGTNITGTAAGLTAGNVTTNANLTGAVTSVGNATSLGSFTSANLRTALTDETGSGSAVFATSPTLVTPALGTPSSATLTNATGLPISTGVSGLGTGVATFLATPSSANLAAAVTDETGTGALVFATSPTLVTPALGTPSALVGTNITGTAAGLTAGSVTTNANLTGAVTSVGNATSLGSFTSAQLAGALTDETGSGLAVFATSPTLVTPALGTPSSATLTNATDLPISTGVSGLGTGVATALAVNVGTAGSPVINGGVLGTPSSGTVTNLTGTASININGTVGATTPSTGAFTTLSSTGNTTLGDATADTVTINGTVQPGVVISGSSTGDALRITQTGSGNALVVEDAANPDATPFVIDSSGLVLNGSTTKVNADDAAGVDRTAWAYQANSTAVSGAGYLASYWANSTTGAAGLSIAKSRGAAVGTRAIIQSGDEIGKIGFVGDDGTNFISAAGIFAQVDGTPGTDDMPGRLIFSTTADGASSPTERIRVTSAGKTGFATAAPAATVHVAGDTILSNVNVLGASYDSVSFSVAAEETGPTDLFFSPDGLKMYIVGAGGDDVNEYNLSTAWVVSSAVFATNFSVSGQDTAPHGLFFRADGTKMYIVGQTNDVVFQYTLSTPWSVATASYDNISFSVAAEAAPTGIFFKPNGLSMYMVGSTGDLVYQYTLSTAWNVSTATFLQSFSVSGQESAPNGFTFTGDGSRMFVVGSTGDDVNVYNLTTPWDISTSVFVNVFSVAGQDLAPNGIYIKPDGTKMYMVGSTNDAVFQYTVPSIDIQLTGPTSAAALDVQQDLTVYGNTTGSFLNNGFRENISGQYYNLVSQADIGTAPNEIPLNQYLGLLAYEDTETPALNVGTGITTGTGTICKANGGLMGGIYTMSILIDLTGLNSGGTAGDIIGVNGTALPCYIAQLPAMTVLGGRMTCLETPAGGDTDIDLYSATEGTGVEDSAITALTETEIINAGAQTRGTLTYFSADPATNAYFYLVGQGTANATYTAGRFLIEIFGVQ